MIFIVPHKGREREVKEGGGERTTVNMVLNVHRNYKAYRGRGEGGGGGRYGGGRRGKLYTYRYTVTTRIIPALRWAAMSRK